MKLMRRESQQKHVSMTGRLMSDGHVVAPTCLPSISGAAAGDITQHRFIRETEASNKV